MTAPPPSPPAAVAAFLRGLDRRARLFAEVQAGGDADGARALAAVARVFAGDAGQWPLAQWPRQYWRLLLASPALRHAADPGPGVPLPGIARLPPGQRAAVLLHVVAGLDDDDAAAALGLSVPAYQAAIRDSLPADSLGQPDLDVWRAWRAAAQRELERVSEPAPPARPRFAAPALAPAPAMPRERPHMTRWLWFGVAACVLAFAGAFFIHPAGREVVAHWLAPIRHEALPAAAAPKARFDPADAALHPDRERLAAPREARFADQLALLSWLANAADPAAADAIALPVDDRADAQPRVVPAAPDAALAQRIRRWDALPLRVRGLHRGHWQAWRTLAPGERLRLRAIAGRFARLPPGEQQALRERFQAQSPDARRGWWLGPGLGRDWPRIAALFAFVDPHERETLLQSLRDAPADDIDALARLAQSTAPEHREALRRGWLAQPRAARGAWLRARLQG